MEFESLEEAVAANINVATMKLLEDITLTDRLFVNAGAAKVLDGAGRYATTGADNEVTIDLNGHDITSASNIALAGGSLTITNSASTVNSTMKNTIVAVPWDSFSGSSITANELVYTGNRKAGQPCLSSLPPRRQFLV